MESNALSNARHPDETFENYKARLALVARALRKYRQGRMLHESTVIVNLPMAGKDVEVDHHVLVGSYRDLQPVSLADGSIVRRGRTKGSTYRRKDRADKFRQGHTRRQARIAEHA